MRKSFLLIFILIIIISASWADEESFEDQVYNLCCNWNEFFYLLYDVDIEAVEEDEEFLEILEGYLFIIADTLLITGELLMFADAEVSGYGELIKGEIEALAEIEEDDAGAMLEGIFKTGEYVFELCGYLEIYCEGGA